MGVAIDPIVRPVATSKVAWVRSHPDERNEGEFFSETSSDPNRDFQFKCDGLRKPSQVHLFTMS